MFLSGVARALVRITLVGLFLLCAALGLSVRAQGNLTVTPTPPPSPHPTPKEEPDDSVDFGSRENDARTKLILKAEKKSYEDHLARAKEARDLAEELKRTYDAAGVFNAADQKKLERLEKLTHRIRNEVGGSQTDEDQKDLPKSYGEGVTQVADMAKELAGAVEKTPRRVVSASIIEQANKLVSLIRYLRGSHD